MEPSRLAQILPSSGLVRLHCKERQHIHLNFEFFILDPDPAIAPVRLDGLSSYLMGEPVLHFTGFVCPKLKQTHTHKQQNTSQDSATLLGLAEDKALFLGAADLSRGSPPPKPQLCAAKLAGGGP